MCSLHLGLLVGNAAGGSSRLLPPAVAVVGIAVGSGILVRVTTVTDHNLQAGDKFCIFGSSTPAYNAAVFEVLGFPDPTSTTFWFSGGFGAATGGVLVKFS